MNYLHYISSGTKTAADVYSHVLAIFVILAVIAIAIILIVGMWRTFTKAGKPGWAAIVPVYNTYVLAEVGGKPGWWGLVASLVGIIPFVGYIVSIVMLILIALGVARNFGKSTAFGVVLLGLFPIGYVILGFGDAQYQPVTDSVEEPPLPPISNDHTTQPPQLPVS